MNKEKIKLAFNKKELTKKEIEYLKESTKDILDEIIERVIYVNYEDRELVCLQEIIKEQKEKNKELEQALEEWINGERINSVKHISKDKIREKIKEIKEECKTCLFNETM